MKTIFVLALFALLTPPIASANHGVLGEWTTPNGSEVTIYRCGTDVCAKLVEVSRHAPSHVDAQNPDPALRSRPLCGLEIGHGFHLTGTDHAEGGQLYDPESGHTYSGWMTANGNTLELRGYIGIPLFGRTETWTRAQADAPHCEV